MGCSGWGHGGWIHCEGPRWPLKRPQVLWWQQCSSSRGNERGISMGVRSGGHDEGDGKGGRRRLGLVNRVPRTCIYIKKRKIVTLKNMFKQNGSVCNNIRKDIEQGPLLMN